MKLPISGIMGRLSAVVSLSPLLCLAVLLIFPWTFAARPLDLELLNRRHVQVKAEIESIPDKLGRWIKFEDVELPTGALDILMPNAYMSRIYQRLGEGKSVFATVMVLHCSDVRDMNNHYPPVCYPRSGWTPNREDDFDWTIEGVSGLAIMGRTYTFTRLDGNAVGRVITVADTFVLPGNVTTRNMSDLKHVASRYRNSIEGVAQIQIYFHGDYRDDELRDMHIAMIGELLEGLPTSLYEVLGGKFETLDENPIESTQQ